MGHPAQLAGRGGHQSAGCLAERLNGGPRSGQRLQRPGLDLSRSSSHRGRILTGQGRAAELPSELPARGREQAQNQPGHSEGGVHAEDGEGVHGHGLLEPDLPLQQERLERGAEVFNSIQCQFEFDVDSHSTLCSSSQIILDSLLVFYDSRP